jgi:hypothetical protein
MPVPATNLSLMNPGVVSNALAFTFSSTPEPVYATVKVLLGQILGVNEISAPATNLPSKYQDTVSAASTLTFSSAAPGPGGPGGHAGPVLQGLFCLLLPRTKSYITPICYIFRN